MKRQIHLKPEDLKGSDKLGLTYNLGQAHKMMLLRQSGIMKKFGLKTGGLDLLLYLNIIDIILWENILDVILKLKKN